jgi:DHA1 family multidrug resistance protein-like MFS transporter
MQSIELALKKPTWRKPIVLRLLLIAMLAEIGYAVLNISAMPVYLKFERGLSATVIGLVLVAFLLSEAIFKGPMGSLADRFGRKRLIVAGPTMTFFTSLATLIIPTEIGGWQVLALIFLRALDGLGAAMIWPAAFALMGESVDDRERQLAMSMLNMCYLVGVGLALPIGGAVNDFSGTRSASLYLSALLFMIVALTALRFLPSGREHREKREVTVAVTASASNELARFVDSARRIPEYLTLAVVTFAGVGFPMAIIKLFAEQQFRMSESSFGLLVLPAAGLMVGLSMPMSRLGERLGRARAVHYGLGLCTVGLLTICLGSVLPFMRTGLVMALGAMPIGLGFLLAIPAWYASVNDIDPVRRGSNIGSVMTAQGLGAIVGAPVGALLYERMQYFGTDFGRYSPFVGCLLCVATGWLISLRILHKPAPPAEPTEPTQALVP